MQKRKTQVKRLGGFIIDAIISMVFLLVFSLEISHVIVTDVLSLSIAVDVIIVLLPTIITIVSIVLSLTREKIYGVTFNDFNRLRGFWFYSFIHMIGCLIVIFSLFTICSAFNLTVSIYLIDAIAVFYSAYFSIQEIPVLIGNKTRIGKILKNRYKMRDTSDLLGRQETERILIRVIENIILTEGLKTAYKTLSDKKDKKYNGILLNNLLDIQNRYFWDANDDIEFIKSNINGIYREIDISVAIENGFNNLKDLLKFDKDFDYKNIVSEEDETYQLTRSLFSLYRICESNKLVNKENKKLKDIANCILYQRYASDKDKTKPYSFIALMAISTLPAGETWFLKSLRDGDSSAFSLFSINEQPIGLFLSILIAYIVKVFPANAEKLETFVNEPILGLNNDGRSWKQHVEMSIERAKATELINSLTSLLQIYNSIKSSYFENIFIKENGVIHDYYGFTKDYIFNAWIEIVLFSYCFQLTAEEVQKEIESLTDNEKETLAYYLPKRWIHDGKLKNDSKLEFLSLFGDESYKVAETWHNNKIINVFVNFHNKFFKKKIDEKILETSSDLLSIKARLTDPFNKIQKDELFDKNIDLSNEKLFSYSIRIDGYEFTSLVDSYARSLEDSISFSIRKMILDASGEENEAEIDNYEFNDSIIKKIKQINPSFMSENNYLVYDEEHKKDFQHLQILRSSVLPSNFFGKTGSISFNIQLDDEKTIVRRLTSEEIEKVIEKEYSPVNGLYKFSEYGNDETRSILVTKDELTSYISKKIIFAVLVFKVKVVLKDGKYLIVKRNKDKDE